MSAAEKWSSLIQGGIGPDVWDKEFAFSAADFRDAASLAESKAETLGGHVVELVRNDWGQGHAESLNKERAALAETSKERDALQVQLRAWQTAFGTTQLTHALAKMEEAENAVKRSRTDLENAKADAESWHAQQDRFAAELIETSKQLERSRAKWARLREWANDHKVYANGLDFIDAMNRLDAEEKEEL